MSIPTSIAGVIVAIVKNSRLVRSVKPGRGR
jgi:hypothetical protein